MRASILCVILAMYCVLNAQNTVYVNEFKKIYATYQKYESQGLYAEALPHAQRAHNFSQKYFGTFHINTIGMMNHIASLHEHLKNYQKAQLLFEKALQISSQHLGRNHSFTFTLMNNLALLYSKIELFDKANNLLVKVLHQRRTTLGENHPETLRVMGNLASLYQDQRLYEKAYSFFTQSLVLYKQVFGASHIETITLTNNFALLHQAMGQFDKGESLLLQSLSELQNTNSFAYIVATMNNISSLYNSQGKYRQATVYLQKIIKLSTEKLGVHHPTTIIAMNNLAALYRDYGEYAKGETLLLKTLQLRRKNNGIHHRETLKSMNDLALLYRHQGKYDKAEPLLIETLQLRRKILGNSHLDTIISMRNLASLYRAQNRLDKAEPLILETLQLRRKILGNSHLDTLSSIEDLAELYRSQGKSVEATDLFVEVLQKLREKFGDFHPRVWISINNIALLYMDFREYAKAESLLRKTLSVAEKKLGALHPNILTLRNNLAASLEHQNKDQQAQMIEKETLQSYQQNFGNLYPGTLRSMMNVAWLSLKQDNYAAAQKMFDQWFVYKMEYLYTILGATNRKTQQAYLEEERQNIDLMLSCYLKNKDHNTATRILDYSLTHKGILLHFAARQKLNVPQRFNSEFKERFLSLQKKRSSLSELILSPPQNLTSGKYKQQLATLQHSIENLELELARVQKDFARSIKAVDHKTLQQHLPKQHIVIDFIVVNLRDLKHEDFVEKPKVLMAILATKTTTTMINLGDYKKIQDKIQQHRDAVVKLSSSTNKIAHEIYRTVWQPLTKHIPHDQTIYIIPDGDLHLLAFSALVDKNERYLVETQNINVISSARSLTFSAKDYDTSQSQTVIFANPEYGNSPMEKSAARGGLLQDIRFSALPGTEQEGKALSDLFQKYEKSTQHFSAREASKENILAVQTPEILHIATHGFFLDSPVVPTGKTTRSILVTAKTTNNLPLSRNNPLALCGLAFSEANLSERGILTAMEVLSLNLSGTELVVLSACDTSLGKVVSGEGVYSLRRAFQEAGAKAVLSSLWPASDDGTLYLMQNFYEHYLRKVTPQSALRNAQLQCIANDKYSHPYYWANFVMVGIDRHFPERHRIEIESTGSVSHLFLWFLGSMMVIIVCLLFAILILMYKRKVAQKSELRSKRRQRRLNT